MNLFVIVFTKEDLHLHLIKFNIYLIGNAKLLKTLKLNRKKEKVIDENKNELEIYLVYEKNKRFLILFIILFVYLIFLFKRY